MPAPDITLGTGYILVTQSVSTLNILPKDNLFLFGTVSKVYPTSGNISVNQSVMFDAGNSVRMMYGSTIYYQVHEKFISGVEVIPP